MIGSSTVRFACGTKLSTRASADCPIAKRGSNAATPPAIPARRTDRRFMMCPLLIDCPEHVGFRNLLQGGVGYHARPTATAPYPDLAISPLLVRADKVRSGAAPA